MYNDCLTGMGKFPALIVKGNKYWGKFIVPEIEVTVI